MNRTRKTIASAALLGTIAAGGAAGLLSSGSTANAATDTSATDSSTVAAASTATAATAATPATPATPAAGGTATAPPGGTNADGAKAGPHQANGITETLLTGDDLAKATAAAGTAAPGSTVVRAETDADGDAFEVHITQADGSRATVKLNADFSVKTVEVGNGK